MAMLLTLAHQRGHTQQQSTAIPLPGEYIFGELLIKYKSDSPKMRATPRQGLQQDIEHDLVQIGGNVVVDFPAIGWQHVRLPAGSTTCGGICAIGKFSSLV